MTYPRSLTRLRELRKSSPHCFVNDRIATGYFERMTFLSMLERDGQIPDSRPICSACATTHKINFFAGDSLRQESWKRECLGSIGRIWICPRTILSFDQLKALNRSSESRLIHQDCEFYESMRCSAPALEWPLIPVTASIAPSKSLVSVALSSLDAYVCPHWQLKDDFVLLHYDEGCKRLTSNWRAEGVPKQPECACRACTYQIRDCEFCGTRISFTLGYDEEFRRTLFVKARRYLGRFTRPTDPAWIAQLDFPWEFASRQQAWEQTLRECERKFGPNIWAFVENL